MLISKANFCFNIFFGFPVYADWPKISCVFYNSFHLKDVRGNGHLVYSLFHLCISSCMKYRLCRTSGIIYTYSIHHL